MGDFSTLIGAQKVSLLSNSPNGDCGEVGLTHRIVAPACVGSSPINRPTHWAIAKRLRQWTLTPSFGSSNLPSPAKLNVTR